MTTTSRTPAARLPEDQVRLSRPIGRGPRPIRTPPTTSWDESWRTHRVRVFPEGAAPIDLVPFGDPAEPAHVGAADGQSVALPGSVGQTIGSADPRDLVHADRGYLVCSSEPFGRPSTPQENAHANAAMRQLLDVMVRHQGLQWLPATLYAHDRQWVRQGALAWQTDEESVTDLARRLGQDHLFRWDQHGLTPVLVGEAEPIGGASGLTPEGVDPGPAGSEGQGSARPIPTDTVPVALTPALTGCPLRAGGDQACERWGGPWTSQSREAALLWQAHRQLLTEALGCTVCGSASQPPGRAIGLVDLFAPTREGGWALGAPRLRGE